MDKSATQENKLCETKLIGAGNDLFATRNSETFQESITKGLNALKSQLSDRITEYKGGASIKLNGESFTASETQTLIIQ